MPRIALPLLLCAGLVSAADPVITPVAPWTAATLADGPGYAIDYPGTGWPALRLEAAVEPDSHYVMEWRMKGSLSEPDTLTEAEAVAELTYKASVRLGDGWGSHRMHFHSGKATTVKANLHLNPGPARRIEVQGLALRKLAPADLQANQVPDGDFEKAAAALPGWRSAHGAKAFRAALAPSRDFMWGERALQFDGSDPEASEARIQSVALPAAPGAEVELKFWARAEADTAISAGINGWFNPHQGQHFYKDQLFRIGTAWKSYAIRTRIPADLAAFPDLRSRVVTIGFAFPKGQRGRVLLDDVVFAEVGR